MAAVTIRAALVRVVERLPRVLIVEVHVSFRLSILEEWMEWHKSGSTSKNLVS